MDNHVSMSSESQQYQQYYQQPEATNPSAYDPSNQAYYPSYPQYNQTPHQQPEAQHGFSSSYYPDYSNSYQSHPHADPNLIHPPGVTVPVETPQTLVQNHPDVYYSPGFLQHQQPPNVYMPGYSTFSARGGHGIGGKPIRGGNHGSSRGKGKVKGRGQGQGRGRGGARGTASVNQATPGIPRQVPQPSLSGPGKVVVAPRNASCEICKVHCITAEVLEQHMNGKKHKKNLKVYEEQQSLNKVQVELQNPQSTQDPDSNLGAVQPEKEQLVIPDAVSGDTDSGVVTTEHSTDKAKSSEIQTSVEKVGVKRKMSGGRSGKLMKCSDGSKKKLELVCELCNVKCEAQAVFDSHLAGKKHLSNINKVKEVQAARENVVQALHPPNPVPTKVVPSTLQALYPPTPNIQQRLIEAQALASTMSHQKGNLKDPQGFQAALLRLLNQHGVCDAQSILTQLIPFLLTRVLSNGAEPGTSSQLGQLEVTQDQQSESKSKKVAPNESESEMVVDESVQKTETIEDVADKSNVASVELQGEI